MMVYIGQVFLSAICKRWHGFEVKGTDLDFSYKCQSFAYIIMTLIDFTGICYGDSCRSEVLFSMIPAPVPYL